MRKMRIFCVVLIVVFGMFPVGVSGTVTILMAEDFWISVDGQPFRVSGYINPNGEGEGLFLRLAFRLRDIAYILNGTPAQFEIIRCGRTSCDIDGEAGYWIRRGAAYTANFTELQRFSEMRRVEVNGRILSYPFTVGFDHGSPFRNITLGIDGEDEPAVVINLNTVRNNDDTFFFLEELSHWLGFRVEIITCREGFRIERIAITTTRPPRGRTPNPQINRDTFPIGSRQVLEYVYTLVVRRGPGNDYGILTFVYRGDEFEILDYSRRFVQIETDEGLGWIFAGYFCRRQTATEPVLRDEAKIRRVLRYIEASHRNPWIDNVFYESEIIDANVIAPINFFVWPTIYNHIDSATITGGISRGMIEINTMGMRMGAFAIPTMPVSVRELEPGIFELRYDFSRPITWQDHGEIWSEPWSERVRDIHADRRIIVDTNESPAPAIRYYIGDTAHEMVRFDETRDMSRYEYEPFDGGVRLAWRFPPNTGIWFDGAMIRLYRSTVSGQRGGRVREIDVSRASISWLFEFIDHDVSPDGTYFYSLWSVEPYGPAGAYNSRRILIGGEREMTVSQKGVDE